MPLAGSGTLSINDIAGEFGGRSDPESLSEFYRGGGRVPNNGTNSGVPTSGQIAISNFYNASAAPVQLGSFSYTSDQRIENVGKTTTTHIGVGLTNPNNVNLSANFGTWIDSNFDVANSNPMLDCSYPIAQITGNLGGWAYQANVSLSGLAGKTIVDASGNTGTVPNPIQNAVNGYCSGNFCFGVSGRPNSTRTYGFNCSVGGSINLTSTAAATATLVIQS